MSDSSATSSEFSTEVVKEGIVKYRKGNFRRWRKGFFRLTGNGVLTEVLDTKKKKMIEVTIRDSEVSSGEGLTGKKFTIALLSPKIGNLFLKFSNSEDYNKWFHLMNSYSRRNSLNSFELADEGVVVADVKGLIISANFSAVEMFGYEDKSELLGKSVEILMPFSIAKSHSSFMTRYENGGTPRLLGKPREMTGRKKDTTEFPILLSLGELVSSENRNFIATIKDLTRSKISRSKADLVVSKIQTNLKQVIDEQASAYHSIVTKAVEAEIHKEELTRRISKKNVVLSTQKMKDELITAEGEIVTLTKKNNQHMTILNTFRSLCEEPSSIFNVSFLLIEISNLIDNARQAETLFRTDSIITRHLSLFAMMHGMAYLERLLSPSIHSIVSLRKSLEVSPSKVNLTVDSANRRLTKIRTETSSILDSIFDSVDFIPIKIGLTRENRELSRITECLYRKTKEKFSGFEHSICGGFLLLRFICPAIVSPESFGLCYPEPSDTNRRNLILISKYIQYAANGNLVDDVNPMFPLQSSLEVHIDMMKKFIDSVALKGASFH